MIPRGAPIHAALALAATLAVAAPARADDSAAAEALFQQAKTLTDEQRWGEACPKFEASYKLDKTLGTLLNLADCEEHTGRIATAWAHWGEAIELARKGADKRDAYASTRRDAIVKRLPMIQLDVAASKSALEVYRDGVRIDPAAYGVPLPSDPGGHVVSVRRGAEVLAERRVDAKEGATSAVPLDLAAIEKAAPAPAAPQGPPSSQRTAGFVVGGVGIAIVLAAAGIEAVALSAKGTADAPDSCVNGFCTREGVDAAARAKTLANAGQWVGLGGLAVTAVGLTLILAAPARGPAAPRAAAAITAGGWLAPGGGGLVLRGAL